MSSSRDALDLARLAPGKRSLPAAVALLVLALAPGAGADPINPSFESGLANWTSSGVAVATGTIAEFAPTDGVLQALMQTGSSEAVLVATLESDLGLAPGTLSGLGAGTVTEGNAILSDPFVAPAGEFLVFDYTFLTREFDVEPFNNDFGFVLLDGAPTIFASVLDSTFIGVSEFDDPGSGEENAYTDTLSFSVPIPSSGNHTVAFGVVEVATTGSNSKLLVDNVRTVVPEPGTALLLAGGILALGLRRSR